MMFCLNWHEIVPDGKFWLQCAMKSVPDTAPDTQEVFMEQEAIVLSTAVSHGVRARAGSGGWEGGCTHLSSDLLLDALLGLRQCGHCGHVRPSQRFRHLLQCHISEELLHVCEKHI